MGTRSKHLVIDERLQHGLKLNIGIGSRRTFENADVPLTAGKSLPIQTYVS